MDLFDEPKQEFRLFDESRLRFVTKSIETGELLKIKMTATDADEFNERLEKSFCPHLRWQKAAAAAVDQAAEEVTSGDGGGDEKKPDNEIKHRSYVIRRN